MQKEQLRKYLKNQPLIAAIRQRTQIDDTRKRLYDALNIANETGMSEATINELKVKCDEYNKIHKGYGNMIEDIWGISWQKEGILKRHIDYTDDEIDRLPEVIKNIYSFIVTNTRRRVG